MTIECTRAGLRRSQGKHDAARTSPALGFQPISFEVSVSFVVVVVARGSRFGTGRAVQERQGMDKWNMATNACCACSEQRIIDMDGAGDLLKVSILSIYDHPLLDTAQSCQAVKTTSAAHP